MNVFVVTSKSVEKNTNGDILKVTVRLCGVFSDEDYANAFAAKFGAVVTPTYLEIGREVTIQEWINPGFGS